MDDFENPASAGFFLTPPRLQRGFLQRARPSDRTLFGLVQKIGLLRFARNDAEVQA